MRGRVRRTPASTGWWRWPRSSRPFLGVGEAGDRARAYLRRNYARMDVEAFTTLGEELLTHESVLPQLESLALPTTVVVGENDTGLRGASVDLAATIRGAVLEVIVDAGHSPQADQPEAWLRVITGTSPAGREARLGICSGRLPGH